MLKACNTFRNSATYTASELTVNLSNSIKDFGDYFMRVVQKAPVRFLDDLGTYTCANIRTYANTGSCFSINFSKIIHYSY